MMCKECPIYLTPRCCHPRASQLALESYYGAWYVRAVVPIDCEMAHAAEAEQVEQVHAASFCFSMGDW